MDEVAKKIADFCVKNELVEQGMFEWCVYSIEKKLVTFSTWVVLISIGTRLFGFRCTLCFTLGFLVLRRRTNGYHAKTYIGCLLGSILIECNSIFMVRNLSMEGIVLIIALSNLIILKVAPVNNEQIHLTAGEMDAMKKDVHKILVGMNILCLLCVFCHTGKRNGKRISRCTSGRCNNASGGGFAQSQGTVIL